MQFRRGVEGEEESFRNDNMLNRVASSTFKLTSEYTYKKEPPNDREIVNKQLSEMKKHEGFLANTKWMF